MSDWQMYHTPDGTFCGWMQKHEAHEAAQPLRELKPRRWRAGKRTRWVVGVDRWHCPGTALEAVRIPGLLDGGWHIAYADSSVSSALCRAGTITDGQEVAHTDYALDSIIVDILFAAQQVVTPGAILCQPCCRAYREMRVMIGGPVS